MGNSLITSVINTLRSSEVQKMKPFSFGQCTIAPVEYTKLAWSMILYDNPQIVKNSRMKEADADYATGSNKLRFKFNKAVSVEQKALVIHEATHAVMDMLKIKMLVKYAEMFAYIAQCQFAMVAAPQNGRFYEEADKHDPENIGDQRFAAAWNIAKRLQSGGSVDSEDYENLADLISIDPKYKTLCNKMADYNGIY